MITNWLMDFRASHFSRSEKGQGDDIDEYVLFYQRMKTFP